jgi:pyruvate-ferredoxin/flavodoxin oxidoreductase
MSAIRDSRYVTLDANEAVASVAYRMSEVIAIYPITPASAMGEHADAWASAKTPNLWGAVPDVIEMQSEGGAAGAVHGALQAGALTTTFTASQGLLLMLPNLYKLAGELTPFCMHVAARSIATSSLSIFGDHADVMAARPTGVALLCSSSVQEAQDFAAIGHAATLAMRLPILHFFDGFRTSHEIARIKGLDDHTLMALLDEDLVRAHRARGLSPDRPFIRGTASNPDAYFQIREAQNPFYDAAPGIFQEAMARFGALTGRHYRLFDYVGHPEAERVIVIMGSGAECTHETVRHLIARGEKVGVLKVRLFRPFSANRFLAALPPTVRAIAVLDRTKEAGTTDPLHSDVISSIFEESMRGARPLPRVIGIRYGLSSKEFTPAMVKAVFDELAVPAERTSRSRFTVGIVDDVTHLSLPYDPTFDIEPDDVVRAIFYGLGADGTVSANKQSIKIIGEHTPLFAQGHFTYDSKKSGSTTTSYLRFGPRPIRSTYLIARANFVAIHDPGFLEKYDVFERAAPNATVLVNTPVPAEAFFHRLPEEAQRALIDRRCRVFIIDANTVAQKAGLGRRVNTVMQACFFALANVIPRDEAMAHIKRSVAETWGKRGPEVVRRNLDALDMALANLIEIPLPDTVKTGRSRRPLVPADAPPFVQRVTRALLEGQGDRLPVSAFPTDGTWPTGTARYEKRAIAQEIPIWETDVCTQCNRCAMYCPHAAIRIKVYPEAALADAPEGFRSVPEHLKEEALAGLRYSIQVAPEDCTGCGLCVAVCPSKDRTNPRRKALNMQPLAPHREVESRAFSFFETLPDPPREIIPRDVKGVVMLPPLMEFSGACAGCGETPYLRLLTQLFGDRMVIANATGCSSIYGGNLPTTPYTTNADGRGPAWANSLFEDNAEFGLGLRLGLDFHAERARALLTTLAPTLPEALISALLIAPDRTSDAAFDAWTRLQRDRIETLRSHLASHPDPRARTLFSLSEHLVPRSLWIIGGDGWAYDIGYGGLDHVLASNRKVNILVLDTEVYSNTGGQASKATPLGAVAKFASAGKETRKKDLGLLAMSYGHVYVAEVGLQGKPAQTVKAFQEAESYPGPALIIAHSPCIAHGYDLVMSPEQQKRATQAGALLLYRYDPRRLDLGEPPLVLDSGPPTLPMRKYMEEEARFRMVELADPARYLRLVEAAERAAKERRAYYEELAKLRVHPH